MNVSIVELRNMIAEAVKIALRERRITEKKEPKLPAPRSEEEANAQIGRRTRALPGYTAGGQLDFSEPLGTNNRYKRQGASNIGTWTSESKDVDRGPEPARFKELVDILTSHKVPSDEAMKIAQEIISGDESQPLGPPMGNPVEGLDRLIGMVVREELGMRSFSRKR